MGSVHGIGKFPNETMDHVGSVHELVWVLNVTSAM